MLLMDLAYLPTGMSAQIGDYSGCVCFEIYLENYSHLYMPELDRDYVNSLTLHGVY